MTVSRARRSLRRSVRVAAAVVLAVSSVALTQGPASAHSQLLSTSPIDGATLSSPPAEVVFTFDAPLLPDTPTVSINDADGQVVSSGHPVPNGDSVSIPWPQGTPPGDYQVAFRVVCADGQPLIGAITVSVTGAAAASAGSTASPPPVTAAATDSAVVATPAAAPAASTPAQGLPVGAILAIGLSVLVVVGLAIVLTRRRPSTGKKEI